MDPIYEDVPLQEKLNEGIGAFYEKLLRQRVDAIEAAATLDEHGNRPPEVRLGKISNSGRLRIEFTNAMSLPSTEEFIRRNKLSGNSLIEIIMFKGDEDV